MTNQLEADIRVQERKCAICATSKMFIAISMAIVTVVTAYFIVTVHESKALVGILKNILLIYVAVTIIPVLINASIERKCSLVEKHSAVLGWLLSKSPEQQERLIELKREKKINK